jgi:hypothetical protein
MPRHVSVLRWWSGYVRSRNKTRLAQYQPPHKPRLQLAARIALWLHACAFLVLLVGITAAALVTGGQP